MLYSCCSCTNFCKEDTKVILLANKKIRHVHKVIFSHLVILLHTFHIEWVLLWSIRLKVMLVNPNFCSNAVPKVFLICISTSQFLCNIILLVSDLLLKILFRRNGFIIFMEKDPENFLFCERCNCIPCFLDGNKKVKEK